MHEIICRYCSGSSRVAGKLCPICEAHGNVTIVGENRYICIYCSGSAEVANRPCEVCGGIGFLDENRQPLKLVRRNGSVIIATSIVPAIVVPPPPALPPVPQPASHMIAPSRISDLRSCAPVNLDFKKLIRLCEEMNVCAEKGCWYAVIMLTRAILDHVPPVFGAASFTQAASNCTGGKSIKASLLHLQEVARDIADSHLHAHMRSSEVLPVSQQINFAAEMDVLLAEVLRVVKRP